MDLNLGQAAMISWSVAFVCIGLRFVLLSEDFHAQHHAARDLRSAVVRPFGVCVLRDANVLGRLLNQKADRERDIGLKRLGLRGPAVANPGGVVPPDLD